MVARVINSGLLLVGGAVSERLVGLASTVVLARLLTPEQFGLVAAAVLVMGFSEALSYSGSMEYVVRASDASRTLVNTAWTINFMLRAVTAMGIVLSAPLIASGFGEQALVEVLWCFALIIIFNALVSPGMWLLARDQSYGRVVLVNFLAKAISTVVAVVLALLGAQYWALVAGQGLGALLTLIGSYAIHAYRPRFTISDYRRQFGFSAWLTGQSIIAWARSHFDSIIVGSRYGTAQLGAYHNMKYTALLPSTSVIQPLTQPFLRELSQLRDDPPSFTFYHNVAFVVGCALSLPIAALVAYLADDLVLLVLGDQWVSYSEIFGYFAILIFAYQLHSHARRTCVVWGLTRINFLYELVAVVSILGPLYFLQSLDITRFLQIRIGIELVIDFLFVGFTVYRFTGPANLLRLLITSIPIVFACLVALTVCNFISRATILQEAPLIVTVGAYSAAWFMSVFAALLVVSLASRKISPEWDYLLRQASRYLTTTVKSVRNLAMKQG